MDLTIKPLVSFIIPYYNAGETIQETVDSIFNQLYSNFDVWIINDGSTDLLSVEKLKSFEANSKITVIHKENEGPSVARNYAIKKTSAQYVVPLDADDKITENAIEKAFLLMQENKKIGLVYGDIHFFGKKNEIKKQGPFDEYKQLLWNQLAVTCLIRKDVFETCGYYDEFLSKPGLEDWEFFIRVGNSNWDIEKVNLVFFEVRVTNNSRTQLSANKNKDVILPYIYQKHAVYLAEKYQELFYQRKQIEETPDYKIGHVFLMPYRFIKSIFTKK